MAVTVKYWVYHSEYYRDFDTRVEAKEWIDEQEWNGSMSTEWVKEGETVITTSPFMESSWAPGAKDIWGDG